MAQLPISNVVQISVSEAQSGVGAYNVNNLAVFTTDAPAQSFGNDGYAIYLDPTQAAVDFGTASTTAKMANAAFSQQPNMLAGGGYLTAILIQSQVQSITLGAVPVSGSATINVTGGSISITASSTAASLQTALRAISGYEQAVVTGSIASQLFEVTLYGKYGASSLFTAGSNTLSPTTSITIAQETAAETLDEAVTRTVGLVQYFGILATEVLSEDDTLAAAAVVQPLNKMLFVPSDDEADVESGGRLDLLRTGDLTQSRGLYYGGGNALNSLLFSAAYAGRALNTNFEGNNTTQTMHLKDLTGIQPDATMTQTILNKCLAAGADTYISLQGVSKVFTSGANQFFDDVYNLRWMVGALQVAGFNYLAESSTKVPQTESGMTGLKSAYRAVMEQAVTNQYLAPGKWVSSTTFGNQTDFLANIANQGYYIYSQPVSQQSQTARAARQAPLVQIACKAAGAIQSSTVIVYVNA